MDDDNRPAGDMRWCACERCQETSEPVPYGTCHCRCGAKTSIASRTTPDGRRVKGQPVRYVAGHNTRVRPRNPQLALLLPPNPSGLCMCGCGQKTTIATRSCARDGHVCGYPLKYIRGHRTKRRFEPEAPRECACGQCGQMTTVSNGRARKFVHGHNSTVRRISETDYSVEDHGHITECWIWRHCAGNDQGHGKVTVAGRKMWAHRAMYEQEVGPIPEGLILDHLCEVPPCIRPDHVQPKTQGDHNRRHNFGGWNRLVYLSEEDRDEIRRLYTSGGWTHRSLAARFGSTRSTIGVILRSP